MFLREARVSVALTNSNLMRSQLFVTSCNCASVFSIKAEISMAELFALEPPRTRIRLSTSPSLVIAITEGSARSALSASAKSSTATKPDRSDAIAFDNSLDETKLASEVNPLGTERFDAVKPASPSTTNNSDCPPASRFNMVSADTAEEISETTTESASGPRAAATATSHPGETFIKDESRPRVRVPLDKTIPEPSR